VRDLVIQETLNTLKPTDWGRYGGVYEYIWTRMGGCEVTKAKEKRKHLIPFSNRLCADMFAILTDEDVLKIYTYTIRRYTQQR
jgi:hypothetical protein